MVLNRKTRIIGIGLFFAIFIGVFWFIYRSRDFDHKGLKRFVISVKMALIITLSLLSPAHARDNFPGTDGFTPPLSRPAPHHQFGYGKNQGGPRSIKINMQNGATNSPPDRNLLRTAYSKIPNLSVKGTNEQITAWSVAKHAHHGPDFGLDPSIYGMTQSDLDSIANKGLINHISQGGKAPNSQYVRDLQARWKAFAEQQNVTRLENQTVIGRNCAVLKDIQSGLFISFETSTGESFTGYRLTKFQSARHELTGIIGKNYTKK